jgi:hypothetical protein
LEQAILPNPCLEEEEEDDDDRYIGTGLWHSRKK